MGRDGFAGLEGRSGGGIYSWDLTTKCFSS